MSGLARKWKQSEAAKGTHTLERADIGTDQVMETKQSSEGNSRPGENGRQNWSEHGNKARQQGNSLAGEGRCQG